MKLENRKMEEAIKTLANWILESKKTLVFTGAGMDTESNIPDFRGKDGWWRKMDPRQVASIDTLYDNYELFREFYSARINLLKNIQPHKGHYILADLEKGDLISGIATQNVSRLHYLAGSKTIYELHGNIQTVRCNECQREGDVEDFLREEDCGHCGQKALRPNVVLFGEGLPMDAWQGTEKAVRNSDLVIIIGTSLEVYPVNQLPLFAQGRLVLINMEDVAIDYDFHLKILGKAGQVLENLDNYLRSII